MQPSQQAIANYCEHMGLAAPSSDDEGGYALFFDDTIKVRLAPKGRDRVLCESALDTLDRDSDRQAALVRILRTSMALMVEQEARLSFDDATGRPILFEQATVEPGKQDEFNSAVDRFVDQVERFHIILQNMS